VVNLRDTSNNFYAAKVSCAESAQDLKFVQY